MLYLFWVLRAGTNVFFHLPCVLKEVCHSCEPIVVGAASSIKSVHALESAGSHLL